LGFSAPGRRKNDVIPLRRGSLGAGSWHRLDRVVGLSHGRIVFDMPTDRFDRAAFEQLSGPPGTEAVPVSAA